MKVDSSTGLASQPQPEKPQHYTYLKEFRTQQCPLFLQHKCTQHRPYTCFHWHFANQRRRRPIRKRDGTFNYTPDTYCSKYDETTGICPNGDDCPLLHRNSGDTERRYHIRYYKTAICVHETDSKGVCTKNGVHCAFAHGTQDLRNPTYDIRELQAIERGESPTDNAASIEMSTSMEKEKILNDDPKWNDSQYVLANYKTEACKRPPRLCRQGYACPQYHNSKDRRRNPKIYKYRSTPCPQVKQHDEWGDPAVCDSGDNCQYCHTRTEQQFYPEIYKSTKCKDMVQTGYCPRGPFCAFAHVDQEINMNKESSLESPRPSNSLASFIPTNLHDQVSLDENESPSSSDKDSPSKSSINVTPNESVFSDSQSKEALPSPKAIPPPTRSLSSSFSEAVNNSSPSSKPDPIGKGRSMSVTEYQRSNSISSRNGNGVFSPGIGSELSRRSRPISGDSDGLPSGLLDSGIGGINTASFTGYTPSNQTNQHSSYNNSFYTVGDTVESVIGNALDDLNMGDFNYLSFSDEPNDQDRGDTASVCSSLSAGLASSYMSNSFSLPMAIPDNRVQGSLGSLSQSPPGSPLGSLPMGIPQQNRTTVFTGQSRFSSLGTDLNPLISPRSHQPVTQPLLNSSLITNGVTSHGNGNHGKNDLTVQKVKDELAAYKCRAEQLQEAYAQARGACDAWKREAEEASRKYITGEEERQLLIRQRDEANEQVAHLKRELDYLSNNSHQKMFSKQGELSNAPLNQLLSVHRQLTLEMDQVQQLISKRKSSSECIMCQEPVNGRSALPCNHFLVCDKCCNQSTFCPYCRGSAQFSSGVVSQSLPQMN